MQLFVPGRICLFGEHSDWAGGYRRVKPDIEKGYTLICGTDQGIYAEVAPHPSALVLTATTSDGIVRGPREIPLQAQVLLDEAQRGEFWSYVAGVAYQALTHYRVGGLVIRNYKTDLPIKKGLSSSAAICVLAARAFNLIYDLKLTTRGEMELAYQGEVTTPSRCGRMDQGCAFSSRPILMTFDANRLETAELAAGRDLHFVIVDLQAQKDTMEILARLNACYPIAAGEIARGVQELFGPINRRIVKQAVAAVRAGDAERLGALMVEAQGYFDCHAVPACPEELAAPVLHRVLSYGLIQQYIWGGKGVGSQGDGSAQFVTRGEAAQQAVVDIIEGELEMPCLKLTLRADLDAIPPPATGRAAIIPTSSSHRQGTVHKAVIPAAGLGTRLFPASQATKKELFPIVDRDGIAKPALLLIIEEALESGIEEVIVVVQKADLKRFQSLFSSPRPTSRYVKLPSRLQRYAQHVAEMARRVSFVVQPTQQGFGHAVYCARDAVGNEPFLLMLGDHLYRSNDARSCTRQMIDSFSQHQANLLGLQPRSEAEIGSYGTVTGTWMEGNRLLMLTEIAEKPSINYARANLRVPGMRQQEYLTVSGLYLLKSQVFDYLGESITGALPGGGEFELTTALERLCREDGLLGVVLRGESYDIGLPDSYLKALQELRQY